MSTPAVSILMPVYNAAQFLRLAVASMQAQTFRDFELIAIDDGSTDNSKAILDRIAAADTRIRVISRPNTGIVGALNDGLAVARGEFIARMDADDVALPTRIATQLDYLRQHPDCIALGTSVQIVDSRSAVVDRYDPPTSHDAIMAELLSGNGGAIIHPTVIFRATALRTVNGYDPAFGKAEDLDLYLRLSPHGQFSNLPVLGLQYRHHVKSTNFKHRQTQLGLIARILERERSRRNLSPLPANQSGHSDLSPGLLHARWACSALTHGTRLTAIRHGLCSVMKEPRETECWRSLRYVLTARRPG